MAEHIEPENESSDERLYLIGDYINGHMNSDEKMLFEQQLELDAELADEYKMQLEIAETVKRIEREGIKRHIQGLIQKDYLEIAAVAAEPQFEYKQKTRALFDLENNPKVKFAQKTLRITYSIAALLVIAIVGGAILYFYLDQSDFSSQNQVADHKQPLDKQPSENQNQSVFDEIEAGSNQTVPKTERLQAIGWGPTSSINVTIPIEGFSFSSTGLGFASGTRSFKTVFYTYINDKNSEVLGAYKLSGDTLHLYIVNKPEVRIFELTRLQVDDADIELQAGVYLLVENIIYLLKNDGSQHPLVPVEHSIQEYLIKYI